MFSEPLKVPLPSEDFFHYRVRNTFIDAVDDEGDEDAQFEFGMKSCPAGIWNFSQGDPFADPVGPVKVSLDPGSPTAAAGPDAGQSPSLSPVPPGLGFDHEEAASDQAAALGAMTPQPPAPLGFGFELEHDQEAPSRVAGRALVVPQVTVGEPSVVALPTNEAGAAPGFGAAAAAADAACALESRAPSWSSGSALHDAGRCEPCAWYWKAAGCRNAEDCKRCHLCPEGTLKNRKKAKAAMMRAMAAAEAEDDATARGPEPDVSPMFQAEAARSPSVVMASPAAAAVGSPSVVMTSPAAMANLERYEQQPAYLAAAARSPSVVMTSPAAAAPLQQFERQPAYHAAAPFHETVFTQSLPGATLAEAPLSEGSRLHATGECEPCAWFWRPAGCSHGLECRRCHICPEGEVKARKKKKLAVLRQNRQAAGGEIDPLGACVAID